MKKKKVLIIVRGAKPAPHFNNGKIEKLRNYILRGLSSKLGILKRSYTKLADYLIENYDSIELLKWDGDIMKNPSLSVPVSELKKLLAKHKYSDIDIIAVSIGGHILEKTFSEKSFNKINKVLYIGAVHNGRAKLRGINKMINIYSKLDKMFFVSNDLIEGFGNFALKGQNVVNIVLKNIRHDELLHNKKINQADIQEKQLYQLYRNLLLSK
jgi:DNA-binding winged helix-turn-helix (wHTH) protein